MQKVLNGGAERPRATPGTETEGLYQSAYRVGEEPRYGFAWMRRDWEGPVGYFFDMSQVEVQTQTGGGENFYYFLHSFKDFKLSRKTQLLLLQGRRLEDLLIPNKYIRILKNTTHRDADHWWGDILVNASRSYPFDPWIRELKLASLGLGAEKLNRDEVLGAIFSSGHTGHTGHTVGIVDEEDTRP